jgi:hypothetical protein
MAMKEFNEVVRSPKDLAVRRHEEKSGNQTVAIADYKGRYETLGDELYMRIMETSYSVPQFTKSQRLKLNKLCEKLDCYYIIEPISEKDLLEKGMTKRIRIAVSPLENNKDVIELNNFFGITNYISNKRDNKKD